VNYFVIEIVNTGERYRCSDTDNVLRGMDALGGSGIPVGCRNGGCGVCRIEVLEGSYSSRVMSRAHISAEDEQQKRVLACRIKPRSDIKLRVLGPLPKTLCVPSFTQSAAEADMVSRPALDC